MIINVLVEEREDGGVRVSSDDLPGLILSGGNKIKVLAAILPTARALLQHQGVDTDDIKINATFACQQEGNKT